MTTPKTNGAKAEEVTLDVNDLTFGDMCDIEQAIGQDAAATLTSEKPSLSAIAACIWIVKRRDNPELTFDDVKAMRVSGVVVGVE